jgi:hypothetical protein
MQYFLEVGIESLKEANNFTASTVHVYPGRNSSRVNSLVKLDLVYDVLETV